VDAIATGKEQQHSMSGIPGTNTEHTCSKSPPREEADMIPPPAAKRKRNPLKASDHHAQRQGQRPAAQRPSSPDTTAVQNLNIILQSLDMSSLLISTRGEGGAAAAEAGTAATTGISSGSTAQVASGDNTTSCSVVRAVVRAIVQKC
jgi:hypothetical protein